MTTRAINPTSDVEENESPLDDGESRQRLADALKQYWGFDSFRPLQLDAMQAVMSERDSLVVFPTGGGKSLCFQAPAICRDGLAVVVSPLISLMKDQVDALQACGIKAACWNSSLSAEDESEVLEQVRSGQLKLLYLAPERLLTERTHQLLAATKLSMFAIDEAHCVSEWGHDFRPEYRGLHVLKKKYPAVAIHAYTATATQQVRDDIVRQLGLVETEVLVGSMDRPNLNYQIRRRERGLDQIVDVLQKHKSESGIVYCISRKEVEANCDAFNALGLSALPYHAGLSADVRKQNQEAFLREDIDVIVATVAFGMGIDKSNVRYVVHAAMPKSLEAYQQESGRAGRDGLDAECWLFYSGGDFATWKRLISLSDASSGRDAAISSLQSVSNFCGSIECRHVSLAAHFGEQLATEKCDACDVCQGNLDLVEEPLILAQKIVSCVYRVEQRFGADYVAQVLLGSKEKRLLQNRHDELSTYGLLESENKRSIRIWIEQLVAQSFLAKTGEYNVLTITDAGNQLLRGHANPRLLRAAKTERRRSSSKSTASWEGVDQALFEKLRALRGAESQRRAVPAYVVFSDTTLRDMARRRPSTLEEFRMLNGVGQKKLDDYGQMFLDLLNEHCQATGLAQDVAVVAPVTPTTEDSTGPSRSALLAFPHFEAGLTVEQTAEKLGRAQSTTYGYLQEYMSLNEITDPGSWVDAETVTKVTAAIEQVGIGPLKPVFVALNEEVGYNEIRIVMTSIQNAL